MIPSISRYERRKKEPSNARKIVGFLALLVLTLGVVLLLWDLFTLPVIEAAPVVDDQYICSHLEEFDIEGMEAEVIRYCAINTLSVD